MSDIPGLISIGILSGMPWKGMASQLVLWPKLVPNGLRHGKLGLFRGTSFQTDLKNCLEKNDAAATVVEKFALKNEKCYFSLFDNN